MRLSIAILLAMQPVVALAAPHGCDPSLNPPGRYVFPKGKGFLPSTLEISKTDDIDKFKFELESYWAPKPNDDGSSTTQGIFGGEFVVRWCVGHYVSEEKNCFLVFNFVQKQIKVTSFGSYYDLRVSTSS